MAAITKSGSSKIETSDREGLTAAEVASWLRDIPPHARITAIQKDFGSQRDPWVATVGFRASWDDLG